ncbi:MAG: hypothetical protein SF182_07270 [Deltaproteobacteria bacterium]|nr:hypothetical protein [Deltaproteobacteria bacterium]
MTKPTRPFHRVSRAALPAERAFVVQLRGDADLARGAVRGRVEHMQSGAAALFESLDQLVACMQEALGVRPHRAAPTPRPVRPAAATRPATQKERT